MCGRSLYLKGQAGAYSFKNRMGDMSFEKFVVCLDHLPYLHRVLLQGIGEPFLHKDFFRMVKYCDDRKIEAIRTITNGTLMSKDNIRRILDSPLTELGFSLDCTTAETYNKIRGFPQLDHIIMSLRNFVEMRDKAGQSLPILQMLYVMMNGNMEEIPDYLRLMAEIGGVAEISLIPVTIPDPVVNYLYPGDEVLIQGRPSCA